MVTSIATKLHLGIVLGACLATATIGCKKDPPATSAPAVPTESEPIVPAEVELSDAKHRIDDEGNFYFDVKYKFTKGSARQYYLLTVHFPGTQNMCLKHMEAYHLKNLEGSIRDGIPLIEKEITSYEIVLSEADSPMNEYKPISNRLVGMVGK